MLKKKIKEKPTLNKNKIEDNAFIVMADILNNRNFYTNYFLNFAKQNFPDVYKILTTEDCRDLFVIADNIEILENAVYAYLNEVMTIKRVSDSIADKRGYYREAFENYVMDNPELASQMLKFSESQELETSGSKTINLPKIDAELVAGYEKSEHFIHPEKVDPKKSVLKKFSGEQEKESSVQPEL